MTYKIVLPSALAKRVSDAFIHTFREEGLLTLNGYQMNEDQTEITAVFDRHAKIGPDDLEWVALKVAERSMAEYVSKETQQSLLN